MNTVTIQELAAIESLHHVPPEQLEWLINSSQCHLLKQGEMLFKPGDAMNSMYIVLEGRFRLYFMQNGNMRELAQLSHGSVTGFLPFSRGKVASAYGECIQDAKLLKCQAAQIKLAAQKHYELTEALVHIMTSRVRDFTALQQQNEKMFALGKLSAGLAHELNNPAAAISRGASLLQSHVQCMPAMFKQIAGIQMDEDTIEQVNSILLDICLKERPSLSLMGRSDLEDELADWLAERDIKNYEIAENLVDAGFKMEDLEKLNKRIPPDHLPAVLTWISNNLLTAKMVNDIQEASQRISDLVGSVKSFTHMDRGTDQQILDIHTGIRNTLKMLNFKLRKGNVELVENFDTAIPPVKAMHGELNQVWTNLIDNAIDAMEENGAGMLEIHTILDQQFVKVNITDNGSGVPADIQSMIFDPFFTTKAMGKGTGLGLDVVMRIIQQHNGTVKFTSVPGNTTFTVCIPLNNN